ncbi:hypothetical protein AB6D11_03050 [Vibrio splendidus]
MEKIQSIFNPSPEKQQVMTFIDLHLNSCDIVVYQCDAYAQWVFDQVKPKISRIRSTLEITDDIKLSPLKVESMVFPFKPPFKWLILSKQGFLMCDLLGRILANTHDQSNYKSVIEINEIVTSLSR